MLSLLFFYKVAALLIFVIANLNFIQCFDSVTCSWWQEGHLGTVLTFAVCVTGDIWWRPISVWWTSDYVC